MRNLMGYNSHLRNLKSKPHITLFTFVVLATLILSSFRSDRQQWTFYKTTPTGPVLKVSQDRYYNFYVADERGNLFKYDSLGNELLRYSPQRKADITLIEAWRTVNIFLFYRELQEYTLLDRFLTNSNGNFKFVNEVENNEKSIGFARLATLSSDNNLWVFDDEDFSLKKYDTKINRTILNTSLDLILDAQYYDLNFIREYQNLVFINDKNSGILVFDNLGNYKNKLPFKGLNYFNFLDNSIYFIQNGKLVLYDLYKGGRKEFPLPEGKAYNYVLLSHSMAYLAGKDFVDLYRFDYRD